MKWIKGATIKLKIKLLYWKLFDTTTFFDDTASNQVPYVKRLKKAYRITWCIIFKLQKYTLILYS